MDHNAGITLVLIGTFWAYMRYRIEIDDVIESSLSIGQWGHLIVNAVDQNFPFLCYQLAHQMDQIDHCLVSEMGIIWGVLGETYAHFYYSNTYNPRPLRKAHSWWGQ